MHKHTENHSKSYQLDFVLQRYKNFISYHLVLFDFFINLNGLLNINILFHTKKPSFEYQKTITRFCGFKIGERKTNRDQYFDKLYEKYNRLPLK